MKVNFRIRYPEVIIYRGINIYTNVGYYSIVKDGGRYDVFYEGLKISRQPFLFMAKNIIKNDIRKKIIEKINLK